MGRVGRGEDAGAAAVRKGVVVGAGEGGGGAAEAAEDTDASVAPVRKGVMVSGRHDVGAAAIGRRGRGGDGGAKVLRRWATTNDTCKCAPRLAIPPSTDFFSKEFYNFYSIFYLPPPPLPPASSVPVSWTALLTSSAGASSAASAPNHTRPITRASART